MKLRLHDVALVKIAKRAPHRMRRRKSTDRSGDAALTARIADEMQKHGVYVTAFSFPVVPRGQARIRVQLSAAQPSPRFSAMQSTSHSPQW